MHINSGRACHSCTDVLYLTPLLWLILHADVAVSAGSEYVIWKINSYLDPSGGSELRACHSQTSQPAGSSGGGVLMWKARRLRI
jgi:hypothetical protein